MATAPVRKLIRVSAYASYRPPSRESRNSTKDCGR